MRLVFAGTPEVAIPSLEAIRASRHDLVAVVTRPPAPQGRSSRPVPSPVHRWGLDHGLEVLVPDHPRDPAFSARLAEIGPDCCPVVAYGALVPERVLGIPRYGWVNLHFSLLPAHRGAAPVQSAILAGDAVTGATVFGLVKELDAGPVYGTISEDISPGDTAGDLLGRLAVSGADLLVRTLDAIEDGARPVAQPSEGITFAPKITPEDVRIDWTDPATEIVRLIHAASPEPGAWTTVAGERFKVLRASTADGDLAPGAIEVSRKAVHVGTGDGLLGLDRVQPLGKKEMAGADWARGARLGEDARFA